MDDSYIWIKAFHIIAMVTWFAGLFYLPRLFVYHASTQDDAGHERFKIMEHKLYWAITTPGAVLTTLLGIWLISFYSLEMLKQMHWLRIKLLIVILLIIYHICCGVLLNQFKQNKNRYSHRWYRIFNEIPVLFLISIILLAVIKP